MTKLGDPKISQEMAEQELRLAIQRDAQFAAMTAEKHDPDRELRLTVHRLEREARLDEILHPKSDWKSYFGTIAYGLGCMTLGYVLGMWHG